MIFKLNIFLLSIFILTSSFSLSDSKAIEEYKYSVERFPTMVESLQNGDHFTIQIKSIGCFHNERQIITIINNEGILTAHFNNKRKLLSPSDIKELINFELQLRDLQLGGCTTVDTYVLTNNYESFKYSDSTCRWSGYKKLMTMFKT